MAIYGEHGVGKAAEELGEYRQASLGIICLQETRRDGQSQFKLAGYKGTRLQGLWGKGPRWS